MTHGAGSRQTGTSSAWPGRGGWAWLALVLVILGAGLVRARLLDVPLDRDEGEYAYLASLMLDGIPPYAGAYNMKMPGVYAAHAAALAVFGRTVRGVHSGLLVVTSISTALVFLLARRLFDAWVGVGAAIAFATLALNPHLLGFAAYAEHFVVALAVLGILLLLIGLDRDRTAVVSLAGVVFGLAFLMKQSGGVFAAFALVVVLHRRLGTPPRRFGPASRDAAALVAGLLLPCAVVAAVLAATGTFATFWFWTVRYAAEYGTSESAWVGLGNLRRSAAQFLPASWPIVLGVLVGLALVGRDAGLRRHRAFLTLLLACSAVSVVSAGFYFRQHYFLLLTPAAALLAGAAPFAVARIATARLGLGVAITTALILLGPVDLFLAERVLLIHASPLAFSRRIYGWNPFPESLEVARYLRARSTATDRIGVIGSEPQIYFYAGRPAATGYIYMYPLMETQPYAAAMQRHMIAELEAAHPRFLVFVNVGTSWLVKPASEPTLARWFQDYWKNFDRVGVVDIVSPEVTRYRWDDAAQDYTPQSSVWLAVFRRRE